MYADDRYLCPDDETLAQRYILAVLYFATSGDAWNVCYRGDSTCIEGRGVDPYLSASSECDWYGSKCSTDGMIEAVDLRKL